MEQFLTPQFLTPTIAAFVLGGIIVWAVMQAKLSGLKARLLANQESQANLTDTFKALSSEALQANNEQFLSLATQNLNTAAAKADGDLQKRQQAIEAMLKPIDHRLSEFNQKITNFDKTHTGIHGEIKTMMGRLGQETASLVEVLKTPALRGNWGEVQLKRILESTGMVEGVNYRTQVTVENARPDMVVDMPGGGCIVIDSKAPMSAYFDALQDGLNTAQQKTHIARHVDHVRAHVRALSGRAYWEKFETPEFVVMFFPSESALRLAQETDPNLVHEAFEKNVLMASPMTLIGLLRVVSFGWRQVQMAENAREVSKLGADLYKRIQTFAGYFEKVGNGLKTAVTAYDNAVGSMERTLLSGARKLKDVHVVDHLADEKKIEAIDKVPRQISSEELLETKNNDEKEVA